jgi:DNA polymerase-3 subunit alpha
MAFTHLHVHTGYSLLDASSKISELVDRAKELGMNSLAITDHGVMYGVIEFYQVCLAKGIKPILGCEIYVAPKSRFDKNPADKAEHYYHLILLAENNTGYYNLMQISSIGFTEGFYYRPRVDKETLRRYHEGLIASSACLAGEIARDLAADRYEDAKQAALEYQDIFGKGNFFLEMMDHGIPLQKKVNAGLMRLHDELGIPLIITNDSHYINADDAESHDVLLCIQTGKKVKDTDRMRYEGGQYYLKSEEEMRALFPYCPEAADNTQKIADRCNVEIEFGVRRIPHYACPDGLSPWDYLKNLCTDGFRRRYPEDPIGKSLDEPLAAADQDGSKWDRLRMELTVIHSMGFVEYFLIVWDYVHFARSHGIDVGPGRGSAAGSIVSYCLGITDLDPIAYDLIFERFLNPERVSMPDIDIDFQDDRRQEVIEYVKQKYGSDCVSQIITFGTLKARGVIRDVGRALDIPLPKCDKIAKMVPQELKMTLDRALTVNPELRQLYESDPEVKYLIDISKKLENLPRHASTHAAGVLISAAPVNEFVPLSIDNVGAVRTQFEAPTLEKLGLLKMDFLGLKNLTVICNALRLIEKNTGEKIDIRKIPYDDRETYDYIGTGKCDGIFQLENGGMQRFMKNLEPTCLEDVMAGIALYRPGPMEFIDKYIAGKRDPGTISYECPELVPILKSTNGCIVYQEQVMQIVRDLAGYSWGRSDLVRRAMAKKHLDELNRERKNFVYGNPEEGIRGCIATGVPEQTANHIFDELIDFANYAFNKSHAAVYAVITYRTAYLKRHYPAEFMAATMTSFKDVNTKVAHYILCCRQMGIPILPPDINEGEADFSVSGGAIRYGLSAIKSIGDNVVKLILDDRRQHGRYTSLENFIERVGGRDVNRRALESFIKSGAMDCFPGTRKQKFLVSGELLDRKMKEQKDTIAGQLSLFDIADEESKKSFAVRMPDVGEFTRDELLGFEKEMLGVYVSGHPLEAYEKMIEYNATREASDFVIDETTEKAEVTDGERVVIGGMITGKRVRTTRNNQLMAMMNIEDMTGTVEVTVFPRDYEKYRSILEDDAKVFVRGRVQLGSEPVGKLTCDKIVPFRDVPQTVWICFSDKEVYLQEAQHLDELLRTSEGRDQVTVYLKKEKAMKKLALPAGVDSHDPDFIRNLKDACGEANVALVPRKMNLLWAR